MAQASNQLVYVNEKQEYLCSYCGALIQYKNPITGECTGCKRTYNSEEVIMRELPVSDEIAHMLECECEQSVTPFPEPMSVPLVQPNKAKSDKVGTGLVLIPWYSILAIGKIFIEGLRYGKDNWKKGVNDKDYQEERLEHAMLHLLKWKEGDRTEEHLAKVAWFCVTQLELERLENAGKTT